MSTATPGHDIIVIGASAGGVQAVEALLAKMPAELPASIFAVVHTNPESPGLLAQVFNRVGGLSAIIPEDGEQVHSGRVYVAPPDRHMTVRDGLVRVVRGPRENGQRPSIDVLFRSAAESHGSRVIGVVLTGYLDDGSAGLLAIKRRGGIAVVQDPKDASAPFMPANALREVQADYVLPLEEIAPLLVQLTGAAPLPDILRVPAGEEPGPASGFTCPECGGALWELAEGADHLQYRCRVGHRYSPESVAAAQNDATEAAMWAALRALEERTKLSDRLATHAARTRRSQALRRFRDRATESREHARVLRRMLRDSMTPEATENQDERQAG